MISAPVQRIMQRKAGLANPEGLARLIWGAAYR
jgi:hypothetical protein